MHSKMYKFKQFMSRLFIVIFIFWLFSALMTKHQAAAAEYLYIPRGNTNIFYYMDYGAITCRSSDQWKLQQEEEVSTTNNGFRIYTDENDNEYLLVALGSYYGTHIGDTWEVTLDNNSTFKIMLGDCKAGVKYGHKTTKGTNVIEFIVDTDYLNYDVRQSGNIASIEFFDGNIESMEYLGEAWSMES